MQCRCFSSADAGDVEDALSRVRPSVNGPFMFQDVGFDPGELGSKLTSGFIHDDNFDFHTVHQGGGSCRTRTIQSNRFAGAHFHAINEPRGDIGAIGAFYIEGSSAGLNRHRRAQVAGLAGQEGIGVEFPGAHRSEVYGVKDGELGGVTRCSEQLIVIHPEFSALDDGCSGLKWNAVIPRRVACCCQFEYLTRPSAEKKVIAVGQPLKIGQSTAEEIRGRRRGPRPVKASRGERAVFIRRIGGRLFVFDEIWRDQMGTRKGAGSPRIPVVEDCNLSKIG